MAVTVEDVCVILRPLPRSKEVWVYGRRKFRVGAIVFVAFDKAEQIMGFGFPKEWRPIVVQAEPHKFLMPGESDLRFNWIHARLVELSYDEMRDLVLDAWRMCVPKRLGAAYDPRQSDAPRTKARQDRP
jgi:hypothetical protein